MFSVHNAGALNRVLESIVGPDHASNARLSQINPSNLGKSLQSLHEIPQNDSVHDFVFVVYTPMAINFVLGKIKNIIIRHES